MAEHQFCATLVNASAFCDIEQEVNGDNVNTVAQISSELEREKKKNAELMEKISMLEAQIRERNTETQVTLSFLFVLCLNKC
jgi:Asp-tRNA(Asn)/Glu-tRNA(Gln) amidotransferase B subunit